MNAPIKPTRSAGWSGVITVANTVRIVSAAVGLVNLSWKLAMVHKGWAAPELLDTYGSDRLPVIRQLVRMTERATKVFNSTNPPVHAALTALAPVVLRRAAVQGKAAARLGQVAASYRDCPLAKNAGRIGRLRPGARLRRGAGGYDDRHIHQGVP
jgi:hypothetical protein